MTDISPYGHRLSVLREALAAEGMAGAVISRPQHLFYFTGAMPGANPAFLVVWDAGAVAAATDHMGDHDTVIYSAYDIWKGWNIAEAAASALGEAFRRSGIRPGVIGAELPHLPSAYVRQIPAATGALRELEPLLWGIRKVKDAGEIARIEANVAANDRAFEALRSALRPGMAELDAWTVIYRSICGSAGRPVRIEADLGAGPRGVSPDHQAGNNLLQAGDAVFVDIYSATGGYYADTTRVFTLGEPTAKQREVHGVLQEALAAGEAVLRPGTPANQVDAAVRGVITRAGYGDNFPHHSGHTYGLFQQERPYFVPAEAAPLEVGMVATLEPGIYIQGWGGMRLEGNWVIEAGGARRLDRYQTELTVCPS